MSAPVPVPELHPADLAFGTTAALPAWDALPENYRRGWHYRGTNWCALAEHIFHRGLPEGTVMEAADGIDGNAAMRVVGAHLRSWAPKHEHKIAGVGYLLSQWFVSVDVPGVGTFSGAP